MQVPTSRLTSNAKTYFRVTYTLIHPSIQTPVLDRLGDMFRGNLLAGLDIRNGAGHFENTITGSC